jgi:hypothetical protein
VSQNLNSSALAPVGVYRGWLRSFETARNTTILISLLSCTSAILTLKWNAPNALACSLSTENSVTSISRLVGPSRPSAVGQARAIRQEFSWQAVAIIALTGVPTPKEEMEVLALGARLYRGKAGSYEDFKLLAREIIEMCTDGAVSAATK